jgi:hypothetical protein
LANFSQSEASPVQNCSATPAARIAVEPDLCQIGEAMILGNLLGRQVAMVIDDGQVAGVIVVEPAGGLVLEEKIVGDEGVGQGPAPFLVDAIGG